jgi:2-oxoglutarate ferredoxin oxidoreductase subunit beta
VKKVYKNQQQHDPSNLNRAREIASSIDPIPVGIVYRDPQVPCYEVLRKAGQARPADLIKHGLESEFDKFTVWPQQPETHITSA